MEQKENNPAAPFLFQPFLKGKTDVFYWLFTTDNSLSHAIFIH